MRASIFLVVAITLLPVCYHAQVFDFTITPQTLCYSSAGTPTAIAAQTATYPGAVGYWWYVDSPVPNCDPGVVFIGNTFSAAVISFSCCGTYTITHKAFASATLAPIASVSHTYTYHCPMQPTFSITNSSFGQMICPGKTASLSINGPYSYTWSTGTVDLSIAVSPTSSTMYSATGTDTNGCYYIATSAVQTGEPDIQVIPPGIPVNCGGAVVTLTATGADTYTWNGVKTGNTYSFYVLPGPNAFTVTGTKNDCVGRTSYTLAGVDPAAFTYTLSGSQLNLAISGTCSSFEWDYGNGAGSTINPNPVVTFANPGTYGVCLKCNGNPSCTRCLNLKVPGNSIGGVGLEEETAPINLVVGPNPFNGTINIQTDSDVTLVMCNVTGGLVLEQKILQGLTSIDLSHVPAAIYFIKVVDRNGSSTTIKLAKEN